MLKFIFPKPKARNTCPNLSIGWQCLCSAGALSLPSTRLWHTLCCFCSRFEFSMNFLKTITERKRASGIYEEGLKLSTSPSSRPTATIHTCERVLLLQFTICYYEATHNSVAPTLNLLLASTHQTLTHFSIGQSLPEFHRLS